MFANNDIQLNDQLNPDLRDVTSTARLFNFRRPVFVSNQVWEDCIDFKPEKGNAYDELAILQRLRHVLFMAASTLHGRVEDLQYEFRIYRVANGALHGQRKPEAVNLLLCAHKDERNQPVITISFPSPTSS